MRITCLGTAAAKPEGDRDTASFMVNDRCLIDTGLCAVLQMVALGFDPQELDYLFLTHCHHDHYLGLAPLLFYRRMQYRSNGRESRLTIFGPEEDVERVVERAEHFLQVDLFPPLGSELEVVPLAPNDECETNEFRVSTCATRHGVPGLAFRFTEKATDASAAFTGDTAYDPAIVRHVDGVSLLLHDAFEGERTVGEDPEAVHAGGADAARVAREAGVDMLALVHLDLAAREEALIAAREVFANTVLPSKGQVFEVEKDSVTTAGLPAE